ncbi:SAM-dependent DNA methyltransferase [Planktothrix sp. FACHB-1355]|uniref:site-specific DNA-methyltransferase (adenine-specific) n=1 Tax=Aerosakkonema funiforme FACHB-1375 TaxID=2949571 RepID=A0A926ZK31_9CYAN|nr:MULTISPECIES: class I SAM-dependent DNA methyltransferase [Oscillatoriales]MBD2184972.1 SAM-dependent DNA methyltransferase [Aerosakkonema funiforme FACHB-1375]MBD3559091.1 SAM-dependent DNA methyltransferase [Planktothrix sp. FACHB-1355]
MPANYTELEKRLWEAADELRANSKLKPSEYSVPVLGLIFLRYADYKFSLVERELAGVSTRRRSVGKLDYQAKGALYLTEKARFDYLLNLPEAEDIGTAINQAMKAIEDENEELKGILLKDYNRLEKPTLRELLKTFNRIKLAEIGEDAFGEIYQYFLSNFAQKEGQKGGEFFTPISVVKLIVEVIEPYHGLILDPACGAGGMFVQSAMRVSEKLGRDPNTAISVYGQEKTEGTVKLCQMNLAVHGVSGLRNIRQGNTYYEDIHNCVGQFDFVMANPPFNVDGVDKERLENDPRFPFVKPKVDNANYLWIQIFYSALNDTGRAGFVMANSASDARGSELEVRHQLIKTGAVDVMIAISSNFFYTVTLPCTLWFLDKGKAKTLRKEKVLFIDARHIYRQIDRAHREFTDEQVEFISNIVRLYRGEAPETKNGSQNLLDTNFPEGAYKDVAGLCRVATSGEIEAQGWSLNPGRYVGVAERPVEDFDFAEKLEELNEELEILNAEARELEERIAENVAQILGT